MAAKRATLDEWFTVNKKSSRKSSVEFEAGNGDKEVEANQRAVPAVASYISSNECQLDKRNTTEASLSNNGGSGTFQDCEMDSFSSPENEYSSDLEDDLLVDQLSYFAVVV